MKFRTDFVTNSSSSSFVTIQADNEILSQIFQKYSELLEEDYCINCRIDGKSIEINIDEGYADIPAGKSGIIESILSSFDMFDSDEIGEMLKEIKENEKEILANMESFKIEVSDMGWQGDSDIRFYPEYYPKKRLKEYYKTIAEAKGCSVEEVTKEDFCEFVADKISIQEETATYDPQTGKIKKKKDFYLE